MPHGCFCKVEHGVDINFECQFSLLVGYVAKLLECRLVGGIVDENIEATEFTYRDVHDLAAMGRFLNVSWSKNGPAPCVLN